MTLRVTPALHLPAALAALTLGAASAFAQAAPERLHLVGRYDGGLGAGAAEISAYDPASARLFVVNAGTATVDVLDLSTPAAPAFVRTIDVRALFSTTTLSAAPNSVDVSGGLVAVAVERKDTAGRHASGVLAFFDADGALIDQAPTGALPDMVTFSPDGRHALTANEGEPSPDYSFDPEGSVTVVRVKAVRQALVNPGQGGHQFRLQPGDVRTADFHRFDEQIAELRASGVRIYGPGATVSQDLEPEYVSVPEGSPYAYVTLQEANAIGVLRVETAEFVRILPLGAKDWSLSALDASDRDGAIHIQPWPVFGLYQPDAIATFRAGSSTYFVTANEGDARAYTTFSEERRVKDMTLDATAFPNAAFLRTDPAIGRLTCTSQMGDVDGDGDFDALYTLGGRSFSILRATGAGGLTRVYDSGDALEQITANEVPERFNGDPVFDTRSDNKGPEPEGLAVGVVGGNTYAFVGLERTNGIAMFDLGDPTAPAFVQYVNTSTFVGSQQQGDVAPEGVLFVAAADSPNGVALLVVSHEVSGTVAVFEIR